MEVRVYQIDSMASTKVNALLGAEDHFDVRAVCKACGAIYEGKIKASELKKWEGDSEAKPPKKPEIKCKCGASWTFEKKNLIVNEFSRTGYTMRSGDAIGLKGGNYLYIKADGDFFHHNEKALLEAGAKHASKDIAEKVKNSIEAESDSAAAGVGLIFG